MLQFMKTAFSHLTGQAFNKPILESLAAAAVPTILGSLLGGNDGPSPTVQSTAANPFTASNGLFNTSFQDGNLDVGMNPQLQAIQEQLMGQAGMFAGMNSPFTNQLNTLAGGFFDQLKTDPMEIAKHQFGLMSPILDDRFNDQFLDRESRQFAQGRLGSTGGAQEMEGLQRAQEDAQRQLLWDSLGQGLNVQNQNANMGLALAQASPQLQGMFSNLASNPLNNIFNMQNQGLNLAQTGGNLSGSTATTNLGGYSGSQRFGQGLMSAGLEGLTNTFGNMFQPQEPAQPLFGSVQLG